MNNEWNRQVFDYAQKLTIRCGLGWHGFILNAISELLSYKKNNPEKIADIKFAGKRKGKLYIAVTDDFPVELRGIYDRMERASKRLCEYCGCEGICRPCNTGWVLTLCKDCWIEEDKIPPFWAREENENVEQ